MSIVLIGGAIVVGLALMHDADGTVKLVTAAVSVRGVTWLIKKITRQLNQDASEVIDFTGWSVAGISIIKIMGNAVNSIGTVSNFLVNTGNSIAKFFDWITFWN